MEKYKKVKLIGRGGFGSVYLYQRLADERNIVIKKVPVDQMSKDDRQTVLNESKVLSMLEHPNIISYYENFLDDQVMLIVMEYAEGGTLFEYLSSRSDQLLLEEDVLHFFCQLVLALQYVHSKQILHRDLKSQNILLDKYHRVLKISDFGISKILTSMSKAMTVVGTPHYLSPELCEGKPYNQKSDIWSLGCVLYELLALRKPFESENLPALVKKIASGVFEPVSNVYSCNLRQLLESMLSLNPDERPNTNEIMAQPFIVSLMNEVRMSIGDLPCVLSTRLSLGDVSKSPQTLRASTLTNYGRNNNSNWRMSSMWYTNCSSSNVSKVVLPPGISVIKQIDITQNQIAAVLSTGQLITWDLKTAVSNEFKFIAETEKYTSPVACVAAGDDFTVCLSECGVVSTFGKISSGCLAYDCSEDIVEPKFVEVLFGFNVIRIACGAQQVLALTEDGDIFVWGYNSKGCLGLGKVKFQKVPMLVQIPIRQKIVKVFSGVNCSFAITEDKVLLACGNNRHNKIAMDAPDGSSTEEVSIFSIVRSTPLPQLRIEMVASGVSHSVFLTEDGQVYTVGSNRHRQLGRSNPSLNHTLPEIVTGLSQEKVISIACGDYYSMVLVQGGAIFVWGEYPKALGHDVLNITKVTASFLKDLDVSAIACHLEECVIMTH